MQQDLSEIPNQDLADFEAIMTGGQRLGFSGADGNSAGNASIGDEGVALSPPHPVTGVRTQAVHVRDGLGGTTPLKPGQTTTRGFSDNPPVYTMGSCLWFYDSDFDNGVGVPAGKWCNLEYSNFDDTAGQWFFWDTIKSGQFAGVYVVNTDLSQHPCGDISDLIDGLNFPNGSLGPKKLPVLTQKGLETEPIYPGPIANLFGLGQRALEALMGLMGKAKENFDSNMDGMMEKMKEHWETVIQQGADFGADMQEFMDERREDLAELGKAAEVYGDYLAGNLNNGDIDNEYLGQDYVDMAFEEAEINDKGTVSVGENIIGSGGKPKYDPDTGIVTIPFEYDFDTNEEQIMKDPNKYDPRNSIVTAAGMVSAWILGGKYGLDSTPVPFAGYATWLSKTLGGGKPTTGHGITMPIEQVKEKNPNFYNYIIQNKIGVSESYISESAKLGHFEPDILDVDIKDLRKGIMPEYPKQPPAEMIDGYHQKSPLRPKSLDNEPYVKITKVDLLRNHRIKQSEVDEMMDTINQLNDYIKKHPEDLIHAQQRYPKDDPRLAELNWKMDQMLNSSEEYLEKNYKFNDKLLKRAIDRTKNNIKLTDPEYVQQHYDELRGTTQGKVINPKPRDIKLKSKLKKHLPQYESKSFFKHVDSNDYKKISERKEEQKRLKLENETALNKVTKERQEYVNGEMLKQMSDWRKDISESDFTNITKGNRIGQTFQHASGATITIDNTMSDPSDQPSQVTLDLGFGEKITVDAPSGNEYGIAGITSHLGASGGGVKDLDKKVMQKQNVKTAKQINRQTDASDKVSKSKSAKLDENLTLEEKKVEVEKYKNAMEEYDKKATERAREIERRIKVQMSKVDSFLRKYGQSLPSKISFDSHKKGLGPVRIVQGGKKLLVISHSGFNYKDSKQFNVRVYEAMPGRKISMRKGQFKYSGGSSILDNIFKRSGGSGSGTADTMYMNIGDEIENKDYAIKDIKEIEMPQPPKFMEKNMSKGWQPSATSSFDQEFIDKMKIFAGKNFVSSLAGSNFAAQLSVQLAQGDLTPVTKSPGPAITNIIKSNIEFTMNTGNTKDLPDFDKKGNKIDPELKKMHSFYNPITGKGAVRYSAYGAFGVGSAPVSASLGQYTIERTDKGMRITDKFDISGGFTAPGGATYFSPLTQLVGGKDVQSTGETLTAIAARRAAELGYDMVDADTGEALQPIYAGEEEFNSRNYPNAGAPTIATPKGYNIKIDFTIPWSSFSPQTANLLKIGGKQIVNPLPNKTVQGIKKLSKSKFDGFDRGDLSFKRKKKKDK